MRVLDDAIERRCTLSYGAISNLGTNEMHVASERHSDISAPLPASGPVGSPGIGLALPEKLTDESKVRLRNFLDKWIANDRVEFMTDMMRMTSEYDNKLREMLTTIGSTNKSTNFTVARQDLQSNSESEAFQKLLAESRLVRELLEDVKCGICLEYVTQYEVGCAGGHTLCKTCLESKHRQRNDQGEIACPFCRDRVVVRNTTQPVPCRRSSRLFSDVVGHVCPLCTDPKERSLEGLLAHVKQECVSVVKLISRRELQDMKKEWAQKLMTDIITPSIRAFVKKRTDQYDHRLEVIKRWSLKRAAPTTDAESPPCKR